MGDFSYGDGSTPGGERRFDVATCLGVVYPTIQHYRMFMQMTALQPNVIVIDNDFHLSDSAVISVRLENIGLDRATIAQQAGQAQAPVGRVGRPALAMMMEPSATASSGTSGTFPEEGRRPVMDYFDKPRNNLRRFTCFLRPA